MSGQTWVYLFIIHSLGILSNMDKPGHRHWRPQHEYRIAPAPEEVTRWGDGETLRITSNNELHMLHKNNMHSKECEHKGGRIFAENQGEEEIFKMREWMHFEKWKIRRKSFQQKGTTYVKYRSVRLCVFYALLEIRCSLTISRDDDNSGGWGAWHFKGVWTTL